MDRSPYVVGPAGDFQHTHTIIFLHGRGSDCDEFASELFESEASDLLVPEGPRTLPALFRSVRWVFPSAPQTLSERFGAVESQWFDMWAVESPDERFESQVKGLRQSVTLLEAVIANEEALVPRNRIFLAGISQGFAAAITAALLARDSFAGLIGLCTWMPKRAYEAIRAVEGLDREERIVKSTSVFLAHSRDDGVVPVENGRGLRDYLSQHFPAIEWHEYESAEHWIVEPEGVDDIVTFLRSHIGQ
ncbi:hypothetical protein JX265_006102 [Neoarthrinium moseri]|uniref:Phospholipase/carboxylesterase/thioesterase domain-containing protein n=1 Tax=Neoarthrinium moseri TaxID=1658444 RepID=A0A9P9WN83_9PEZI|nr:hypothetical protein JX266_000563 [Neoarthrinium moseri]KAI1871062.1 hypothetical protein JX265_006102 [Neoarthrinium moseri]